MPPVPQRPERCRCRQGNGATSSRPTHLVDQRTGPAVQDTWEVWDDLEQGQLAEYVADDALLGVFARVHLHSRVERVGRGSSSCEGVVYQRRVARAIGTQSGLTDVVWDVDVNAQLVGIAVRKELGVDL